jgi:hypothetical protein
MSSLKRDIPIPVAMPDAYKILLKKERQQKPAMATKRIEILNHMKRTNYKNEYDRLQGLLEGHADKFNIPGGHWQKDKLINRQQMLKKLFKESYDGEKHPIMKK